MIDNIILIHHTVPGTYLQSVLSSAYTRAIFKLTPATYKMYNNIPTGTMTLVKWQCLSQTAVKNSARVRGEAEGPISALQKTLFEIYFFLPGRKEVFVFLLHVHVAKMFVSKNATVPGNLPLLTTIS